MSSKSKNKVAASTTGGSSTTPSGTVLVLEFPDIQTMARALARVSAFAEDPDYEGVPLSLDQMAELDLPCKRYAGHNFPLTTFDQCIARLGQLSAIEQVTLRAVQECSKSIRPRSLGYIIAYTADDNSSTKSHEKQHAMYYFNADFRSRLEGIWNSVKISHAQWAQQFEDHLAKMYSKRVLVDEFGAIIAHNEYECVLKIGQLVRSVVPKSDSHYFTVVNVALPKVLPPPDDPEDEAGDEDYNEDGTTGG